MAARAYPADCRLQNFFTENYERENNARLQFYLQKQRGGFDATKGFQKAVKDTLPTINPMQFARQKKIEEDEKTRKILEEARRMHSNTEEMRAVTPEIRETLYDGFTKEEKGRYQYLRSRRLKIPERKYSHPVTSSMRHGWKILDEVTLEKSPHATTQITKYTFYTRNGVPDLAQPQYNPSKLYRSSTMLF